MNINGYLTSDTLISLLDGREVTIAYLTENYSDKEFYVYSYDLENNKIVAGKAHSPSKMDERHEILKITLDNEEVIKCTKSHPFILKCGELKNAENLEVGQSLMPLYRKKDEHGYEMILDSGKWIYTHRSMVDWSKKDHENRTVVHHIDFVKTNNEPTNLRLMTWDDHTQLHSDQCILLNEYAKSEVGRQRSRELMSALWADPIWRENRLKQNAINGKNVSKRLKEEGRLGFQAMDKEFLSNHGKEYIHYALAATNTKESLEKRLKTIRKKNEDDPEYLRKRQENGIRNLQPYIDGLKNGTIQLTEEQKEKKRQTGLKNIKNITYEHRLLAQRKGVYTRWYSDKYESFDEFMSDRYPINHKIINIEYHGSEYVYGIIVDKYHNFALNSGIFVHNCVSI